MVVFSQQVLALLMFLLQAQCRALLSSAWAAFLGLMFLFFFSYFFWSSAKSTKRSSDWPKLLFALEACGFQAFMSLHSAAMRAGAPFRELHREIYRQPNQQRWRKLGGWTLSTSIYDANIIKAALRIPASSVLLEVSPHCNQYPQGTVEAVPSTAIAFTHSCRRHCFGGFSLLRADGGFWCNWKGVTVGFLNSCFSSM